MKKRCAIYTRKSTEEGLDQDFNSLDAQRESGETFVASQKHEGWVVLPTRYDDGGWSGSNTERPAMKQLLADIEHGKIDVVVVYKIDRLSRSLIDFVGLLQLFDRKNVAFCAVTQQFSTATPMGRLILNILICFAEFERSNTVERIRDKMAASRKRGKWVGGVPPLGYDVDYSSRKLVVNVAEAKTVRRVFERFSQTGSPTIVADELRALGVTTKAWTSKTGKVHTGVPINRGHLYKVLNQRLYLGEVAYKGGIYPGEHAAILDRKIWDRVHAMLAENHVSRGNHQRAAVPGFLKGVVRCGHCGSSMTMTYTKAHGKMYRYYRCVAVTKGTDDGCPLSQVPAGDLEAEVLKHLRRTFNTPSVLAAISSHAQRASVDQGLHLDHAAILEAMRSLDAVWDELFPGEQERVVSLLVDRLVICTDHSEMFMRNHGIAGITAELGRGTGAAFQGGSGVMSVRLEIAARHRCGRTRFVAPQISRVEHDAEPDALVVAVARAFRWQEQIEMGSASSVSSLAKHECVDEAYIRRQLRLTQHPPATIEGLIHRSGDLTSIRKAVNTIPGDIW